jgi:hypothetical protein
LPKTRAHRASGLIVCATRVIEKGAQRPLWVRDRDRGGASRLRPSHTTWHLRARARRRPPHIPTRRPDWLCSASLPRKSKTCRDRMEPSCREEPGIQTHGGPDQEKPSGLAPRAAWGRGPIANCQVGHDHIDRHDYIDRHDDYLIVAQPRPDEPTETLAAHFVAHSHTPRNRCVRFVFGVAAASRNTRFQAAC